jgi:hypothetical protein
MKSLAYKIKALESSFLEDGAKWRLMISYKRELEFKRVNDPIRKLRKDLIKSMIFKSITIEEIRANHSINPYPVGRCNLELVLAGKAISPKLTRKLNDYLNDYKK